MSIQIIRPSDVLATDIVHSILDAVGREITLTVVTGTQICIVCSGTNPFCLTCSGNGKIDVTQLVPVTAEVRWKAAEGKIYRPEGQYVEGDCTVIAPYLGEETDTLLRQTRTVIVDNRVCVLDKFYKKGSPANRVYLVLYEDEDLEGNRIG